jgi:hypothetical protein
MNQEKYIGMDVHAATISAAVMNAQGKLLMECVLETKAATILEFMQGLRGTLAVTFEEGTMAAWLHDLLKPQVSRLVVCDPRQAALLKDGNKSDRIDARKLAELLRTNQLKPVYHGEHGVRSLKELGRSYLTITQDTTRVMNRIKAVYRSWAIPCSGTAVYAPRHRQAWLAKIVEPGVRVRAERLYQQLDSLEPIRLKARRELVRESQKHSAVKLLRQIPSIGRSDSRRLAGGAGRDATSFPHQAAVVGIQRFRGGNARQRRVPLPARQTATQSRAHHGAGSEP